LIAVKEWDKRIATWHSALERRIYRSIGVVPLQAFFTMDQLPADEASRRSFEPIAPGTSWGRYWEYAWFKTSIIAPTEAKGQRLCARFDTGGDATVYIDGKVAGAVDQEHREFTLTPAAEPGRCYECLLETYAGHGPLVYETGPLFLDGTNLGGEAGLEVPAGQVSRAGQAEWSRQVSGSAAPQLLTTLGHSELLLQDEQVFSLWIDVETLRQLRTCIDADSLQAMEIDQGLRDFSLILDFESGAERFQQTLALAQARLASLLACTNGTLAPEVYAIGHSHIDIAWMWPRAETDRKVLRTLSTQLALMEEYPEYRYLQSQPYLYNSIKRSSPDLYARVKAAVADGSLIPEGGMWVEPDVNLISGESLIRQISHGKRFFRDEFGVDSTLLWLPDVFGYTPALPQIMRGCGLGYFVTAKLQWGEAFGDPFPYDAFIWEGLDGSQVCAYSMPWLGSEAGPKDMDQRWTERRDKAACHPRLATIGFGDGGGGATRNHLELLRREKDLQGMPRCGFRSPLDLFADLEAGSGPQAVYVGELYLPTHRGTYTSQGRIKRANRRCEQALGEAEVWACAARLMAGRNIEGAQLDRLWKSLLVNQFHDILPGSSIQRVNDEALAELTGVENEARALAADAAAFLMGATDLLLETNYSTCTVFNSLSWERRELLTLPAGWTGATVLGMDQIEKLEQQYCEGRFHVVVNLPAMGWTSLAKADAPVIANETPSVPSCFAGTSDISGQSGTSDISGSSCSFCSPSRPDSYTLPVVFETEILRIAFNNRGEILSMYDKESGRELAAAPMNRFMLYADVPSSCDAWDIESSSELLPLPIEGPAELELVASGPLVWKLRVVRRIGSSTLSQEIVVRQHDRRVDFHTVVDWRERHKLLKVCFPTTVQTDEALHEVQFGYLARPTHRSRAYDAVRWEVWHHGWAAIMDRGCGCALMNDCKYGISVGRGSLELSLLRGSCAPDPVADLGRHEFTYAVYAWSGDFSDSAVVCRSRELNILPMVLSGKPCKGQTPEHSQLTEPGLPDLAGNFSLFKLEPANLVIQTLKPADDGSEDLILRLYESMKASTRGVLTPGFPVREAWLCDLLENKTAPLTQQEGDLALDFGPFEIKTVRLRPPFRKF
jgi:alpha-mannosidase